MATPTEQKGMTLNAAVAWGVLFLAFIALTDIPATQQVAAMFAWLFFVSVLFTFGPDAFNTITTINKAQGTGSGIARRVA